MVEFEWHDEKAAINEVKHGIAFDQAVDLFDGRRYVEVPGRSLDEDRYLRIGMLGDILVCAVWTQRGNAIRLISVRRARDSERALYRKAIEDEIE